MVKLDFSLGDYQVCGWFQCAQHKGRAEGPRLSGAYSSVSRQWHASVGTTLGIMICSF